MSRYNIKGFMDKEYDMRFGRSDTTSFSNKLYFMRGRQYDSVYGSNHMLLSRPVLNDIIVARNAPNVPVSTEGSSNASTAPTESDGNTIDVSTAHSRYVPTNISTERSRNRHSRNNEGEGTMGAPDTVYNRIVATEERDIESNRPEYVNLTRDN